VSASTAAGHNTELPTSTTLETLGPKTRILLMHGGWSGHAPERLARTLEESLFVGADVESVTSLEALNADTLGSTDLLVPVWTFGTLTEPEEAALLAAVQNGLGVLAFHGAASAFLTSRAYKHMLGGQFVAHPGGENVDYEVEFASSHPLVQDLGRIAVTSEQYYLLVDPAVEVLASTRIVAPNMEWLRGVTMPVVWRRQWGKGRVFYCSLGHDPALLEEPALRTLLRRGAAWAKRKS
jgi:type 1 glutamine amidotransferase